MIRKILSLPTLALCFTLCTALFAGCGEKNDGFVTEVRWSNVKNPEYGEYINIRLKAEGETFTTVGDHSWISFSNDASTLDTFTRHRFPEMVKDTAYYKDIVIYMTRNERERTTTSPSLPRVLPFGSARFFVSHSARCRANEKKFVFLHGIVPYK